ncbi:GntR family transcriptional regulator [Nonomuraea rhizosphaerae]|uniref:GntR family transcriptional regulator n=1 Tax=Nonomuraea rhizosphaerae TaxID=2665663 RepID=UPI001C5CD3C1|nr:GntR family transcriptional regulator [Nonomuraea rhizosphaerae]
METVDHFDPTPKHVQIANIVRGQIQAGELEPLTTIPSETRMEQIHGVARDTVRKAMRLLAGEGWVFTIAGRGTFVSPRERWPEG